MCTESVEVNLEDLNVDDKMISKWVLRKRYVREYWIDVADGVDK